MHVLLRIYNFVLAVISTFTKSFKFSNLSFSRAGGRNEKDSKNTVNDVTGIPHAFYYQRRDFGHRKLNKELIVIVCPATEPEKGKKECLN